MSVASASYLARRVVRKERLRILYRRALKDTLNWAFHCHLFHPNVDALREKFEADRNNDIETIDRMTALIMMVFHGNKERFQRHKRLVSIQSCLSTSTRPPQQSKNGILKEMESGNYNSTRHFDSKERLISWVK